MKLFLSWSGEVSQQLAQVLKEWLPLILPAVKPFITSADIEKGARWQGDISRELQRSNFGVLCLTQDNLQSPWLTFEAGALSKQLDARVATILFGIAHADVKQPLAMFQGTVFAEPDFRQLISSINAAVEERDQRPEAQLDKVFPTLWPKLKDEVEVILKGAAARKGVPQAKPRLDLENVAEELLSLARNQASVLSSPERMLAPVMQRLDALERNMRGFGGGGGFGNIGFGGGGFGSSNFGNVGFGGTSGFPRGVPGGTSDTYVSRTEPSQELITLLRDAEERLGSGVQPKDVARILEEKALQAGVALNVIGPRRGPAFHPHPGRAYACPHTQEARPRRCDDWQCGSADR